MTPDLCERSSSNRLALSRLCESFRSAAEALLLRCDLRPAATGDLWIDPITAQTSPFAQALSNARSTAEKDGELRGFARPLDELEDAIVRGAGWKLFPKTGGVGWCSPDAPLVPRTRTEAAELVRLSLEGKG